MDRLKVKCRSCGKELEGYSGRSYSCGCPNMTTITGDSVTARDLSKVIMINSNTSARKTEGLTEQDLMWQEERRKRKVRKLDFEVR
jgi:GH24 family phage-related lysozyme (muramidase)